jgi:hypothetical protein
VVGKSFLNLFASLASRITSRCTRPDKSYLLRVKAYWRRVSLVVRLLHIWAGTVQQGYL